MLDTSVLVSGTVWPRWPHAVLQHALHGDFRLVLAPLLIDEATRVFQKRFPQHLQSFQGYLKACAYEEAPDPTREAVLAERGLMRDMNDVPIAVVAIQAGVDCFVSEDKDFTDRNDSTQELHRRLQIYLAGAFLRQRMGWRSDELEALRGRTWNDIAASRQRRER
jgi:predicted nucleic acid-binding protein